MEVATPSSELRVGGTAAGSAWDAGNLVRLLDGGRYCSGDLFQCGPSVD